MAWRSSTLNLLPDTVSGPKIPSLGVGNTGPGVGSVTGVGPTTLGLRQDPTHNSASAEMSRTACSLRYLMRASVPTSRHRRRPPRPRLRLHADDASPSSSLHVPRPSRRHQPN